MASFANVDELLGNRNNIEGERLIGRVKWFNNKAGYGFITVTDGFHSGTDVFVHHTSISVSNQRYKYLEQGEYVEFTFSATQTGNHPYSATNITGFKNGTLMCDMKNNVISSRFGILQSNNETLENFYDRTKYKKRMNEHRPPEISIFIDNEFRDWKKNIPMAPKACDSNTMPEKRKYF